MQAVSVAPATHQQAPGGARVLGLIGLGVTVLIVAYWTVWYAGGRDLLASAHTSDYYAFENAFPAADAWLALCACFSGVQLLRSRPSAISWLFLTAGAGIYLGLMDVLFDLEHGVYLAANGGDPVAVGIEIAINLLTFTLSGYILWWAWRNRGWAARAFAT